MGEDSREAKAMAHNALQALKDGNKEQAVVFDNLARIANGEDPAESNTQQDKP